MPCSTASLCAAPLIGCSSGLVLCAAHSSFQLTHRIGNILLPGLNIVTVPQYVLLCLLAALLCLVKEYLFGRRSQLSRSSKARRKPYNASYNAPSLSPPPAAADDENEHTAEADHSVPLMSPTASRPLLTPSTASSSLLAACYPSVLYGVNMLLAYVVMLLVMSYNVGLIAVIVVSSAVGHYYFSRPDDVDDSRRLRLRDGREGRARSANKGRQQPQQLVGRRSQFEKGSERVELEVDDDTRNEDDWLEKDCCEQ